MDCRNCILRSLLMGLFVLVLVDSAGSATWIVPSPNLTTIQAAVNAAAAGDTIEIQTGIYKENVIVNKQLTLIGSGLPVVNADGSGDAITLSANGCTLKGFVVKNSGSTQCGIRVTSNENTISENTVTGNSYGIFLVTSTRDNSIILNNVNNNAYGIYLSSSTSANYIDLNNVNNNAFGISLFVSNGNKIPFNNVNNNALGILLIDSIGNEIFCNTFFSNNQNALSNSKVNHANYWNAIDIWGYSPFGRYLEGHLGNIWSDYNGCDRNPNDGIGDKPHPIPGGKDTDDQPIMFGNESSPVLEAEKSADRSEAEVGDWINYTVQVNNTGNVSLTGVRMEDKLTGAVWNVGTLEPGQSYTNTTRYQVNLSDLPGPLINELQANGTDPCGGDVNASAIETVNITGQGLLCISGYKVDECTGDGLADWEIILNNSSGEVDRTTTNSTGYYEFCGLESGDYDLSETLKSGWMAGDAPGTFLLNLTNVTCQNFTNHKLLCISGYKVDECTGDGLADWEIILNNSSGEVNRTLTKATGYYEFCELEPGEYNLSETLKPGWKAGYAPGTVTLDCDNITCQNFTNHEPLCIKGAKFDNCTGEGLANWTMELKNSTGSVIKSTVTDTEGKYSFCNLEPGNYTVSEILKDGYISAGKTSIDVELKCENSEDNDFKNIKLLCINGTKTNALTGDPLRGCYINLTAENGTVVGFTTTEADGRFSFCGLEPGNYTICEFMPGTWKNVTDRCIYVELECEDVVINFQNVPTALCINGSKINNCTGVGLANWTIELKDEAGAVINSTETDANGDYSFCGLMPGNCTVCEQLISGWKNVTPLCISVKLGDSLNIEGIDFANDPPVCINGTKINDCTGEPISNWKITLYDIAGNKIRETVTDANGRYSFCGLTPGRRYWVCEEIKDGWEPVKDQKESVPPFICPTCKIYCKCVDLTCEGAEIDFRNVQRSLCINGTKINNCTGEGLFGWTIELYNASGIKIKTTQTDRNGHYSFCGLAPGVYRVCEETRPGWIPVTYINHSSESCAPGECENCIPVILDCENSDGNDFENIPPLSIVGRMIDDCTGLGMANEVVKLYDAQGVMKSTARTNATGYYVFNSGASLKLTSGSLYTVCEVVKEGWTPVTYHANTSNPASNEYCIPVFLDCGETEVEDFENIPPMRISGHEFNHCTGEGISGWLINLKDNSGNLLETTTTDDAGYYEFSIPLKPGWYTVCEDSIPEGWTSFRDDPNSPAMALPGASAAPEDCETPKCLVVRLDNCDDSTDNDFENIPEFCIKGIVTTNNTTEVMTNFPVKIENSDGSEVQTVSTNDFGEYSFCGLKDGTYTVCVAELGWTADEPCAIVYLDCEDMDQNFDVYKGRNTLVPGITQPAITLDDSRGAVVPGAISVEPGRIGDEAGDMDIEPASREILNPQMT